MPDTTFFLFINDRFDRSTSYPLFVFSKNRHLTGQVMMPDVFHLNEGYEVLEEESMLFYCPAWEKKKDQLIWRGSTGQIVLPGMEKIGREILCELSQEYPELIDAGFTFSYHENPKERGLIDKFGKGRVSYEDLLSYKYHIWIDGYSASFSASCWRMFSYGLIFKPDSDNLQWYYDALVPYEHYVPIRADLSDLMEKLLWAQEEDFVARKIAANARHFALQNLTKEKSDLYLYTLLWEYSKLRIY